VCHLVAVYVVSSMASCTLLQQRRALLKNAAMSNPISRLVVCGQDIGHPVIFSSGGLSCSITKCMWECKAVWGDVMVLGIGNRKGKAKKNAAKTLIKRIVGNIQNASSTKVSEVDIIHISDDDHEENNGSSNNVSTSDIGNTSGESKINEKNKKTGKKSKTSLEKSDQDLYPGKYNIISVHVELLRSSQNLSTSLTQIGCEAFGSDDSFFRSIKPSCLEEYLDCYKLGGDLLQAVHMTREEDGTFLFRERFEDVEKSNKVVCVEESEALGSLRAYLQKYPNCVILGVDQETLAILAEKIGFANLKKLNVVGFTYWKRVLEYLNVEDFDKVDLEDFCVEGLGSYSSALDIAKMLMKSVDEVSSQRKSGKRSMRCKFYKLCKNIDFLSKPKQHVYEIGHGDYIEVFSSFRPTMAATISAEKLDQVVISSESDSEPEETGSMDCQGGQENNFLPFYWKIGKFKFGKSCGELESCVFCPWCNAQIKFGRIRAHIKKAHGRFSIDRSLLCAACDKEVLPSEVRVHMPSCIAGLSRKRPALPTKASKISFSSKANSNPSKEAEAIPPRSGKGKSTPILSEAASRARTRSDQLESNPPRRSLRLLKKSGLPIVQGQQRKVRVQIARLQLPAADPPCAPAKIGPPVSSLAVAAGPSCATSTAPVGPPCAPSTATAPARLPCAPPPVSAGPPCAPSTALAGSPCAPLTVSTGPPSASLTAPAGPPCAPSTVLVSPLSASITAPSGPPCTLPTVLTGAPLTALAGPSCAPSPVPAGLLSAPLTDPTGPPCVQLPIFAGLPCAPSIAPAGPPCAPTVLTSPPSASITAPAGPPSTLPTVLTGAPLTDPAGPPCAQLPIFAGLPCASSTASASPPCAPSTAPAGPPCAPPTVLTGPPCAPSTAPGGPPCAPPTVSAGPLCASLTAAAGPPCALPPISAGLPCAPSTAPAGPSCAPPPVSAGPPSTASIGPPLFFNNGSGLIHPDLYVFEGVPDNLLRSELERYITTNFYPVGLGGWGYVHCLWMYEDYQKAMVSQGRRVVVSPRVFSILVQEVCEKHWGILLGESKSSYGPLGNSQFQFCFVGIVPKQK